MGKQRKKTRDEAKIGTGKVTSTQVAFMVECYLRDEQYTKTLTLFRDEASALLSPFKSVPKSLMSLSTILNEYIMLKEQQMAVAQEKARMDRLFRGLHEMVGAYQGGSLPAWYPSPEGSLKLPTLATSASIVSNPVSGLLGKTASTIKTNNPRSISNLQQKSSIEEEPLTKRKIHAISRDLQEGDVDGAAQSKRARLNSAPGDLAKIPTKAVANFSYTQEVQAFKQLQPSTPPVQQFPPTTQNLISVANMPVNLTSCPSQSRGNLPDSQHPTISSSQNSAATVQTNACLQDPYTPPRPGFHEENITVLNGICSHENRSELARTSCVVNNPNYSYADNNSPLYASNATSLLVKNANIIERVKGKKQGSKCRTLDFEASVTSSNSGPSLTTEFSADETMYIREDVFCQTSSELSDSFLEDFLNSEAVTPVDMSALDDILADLGDVSFTELLGGPVSDLVYEKLPHPELIHETRSVNNDKIHNNDQAVQTKDVEVLAQLTNKDINRQDITKGKRFSGSSKKNHQPYNGEKKGKEMAGKENIAVKAAASSLRRL